MHKIFLDGEEMQKYRENFQREKSALIVYLDDVLPVYFVFNLKKINKKSMKSLKIINISTTT